MQLVFSDQPLPTVLTKSLFLAGPSPRSTEVADWRHAALAELERLGYDGVVLIPIPSERFAGKAEAEGWSYDNQIAWECAARELADIIVFWLPRVIDRTRKDLGMPGFTTNFELGEDLLSGKVAYGRPDTADKCRYMDLRVREKGLTVHDTLNSLLEDVVTQLGEGALRQGGESQVPLFIWKTDQFQSWLANLRAAGNRLDGAQLRHSIRLGGPLPFFYVLQVKVWVAAEQRHKANEFIIARKDISAVVAYHRPASGSIRLALVREFRSTVNNAAGYVYELPGGSSLKPNADPHALAQEELAEETGLVVEDAARFRLVGTRQLAATFSTHRAQVYAIELTADELAQLQSAAEARASFGLQADSECTFVEVADLADIFKLPVDYATLGMVIEALGAANPQPAPSKSVLT